MLPKPRALDQLLRFASTSRLKSAVTIAAVSFAICHLIVLATSSTSAAAADPAAEIPRRLIHLLAEICRFALPLGAMFFGMIPGRRTKQSAMS